MNLVPENKKEYLDHLTEDAREMINAINDNESIPEDDKKVMLSRIDEQLEKKDAICEPRIRMKHISHLDLDGYGATLLSEHVAESYPEGFFYLETENILPAKLTPLMEEVIEDIDNWDIIVVTDLSINPDLIEMINNCKSPEKIHIFDHHEYDKEMIKDLPDSVIVREKLYVNPKDKTETKPGLLGFATRVSRDKILTCATALYYEFLSQDPIYDMVKVKNTYTESGNPFVPSVTIPFNQANNVDPVSYFVECVRIYDTFEFWPFRNEEDSEMYFSYFEAPRLNTLFHILEREEFKVYIKHFFNIRKMQLTVSSDAYPHISEILRLESYKNKRYVDAALRRLIRTDFVCTVFKDGIPHEINRHIGVVFAEKNGPVIGNTACEEFDDIELCAVVSNNQVSLYTNRPNVNVREIAVLFGGGGHAEASGLTIPYINANVYNLEHFFKIVECAGHMIHGQFQGIKFDINPCQEDYESDVTDTN